MSGTHSATVYETGSTRGGFTLYLVLMLLTIFSLLFFVALLGLHYATRSTTFEIQKSQAGLLALSGIARAEYFLNGGDNHDMTWETPLFEEPVKDYGLIQISVSRFGTFSRIVSLGKRMNVTYTESGLFGRNIPPAMSATLTLTGHVGGLVLQDGASIAGSIVLHHGSISDKSNGHSLANYQSRLSTRESPSLPFDSLFLIALFDTLAGRQAKILSAPIAQPRQGGKSDTAAVDSLAKIDTFAVRGGWIVRSGHLTEKVAAVSGLLRLIDKAEVRRSQLYADSMDLDNCTLSHCLCFCRGKLRVGRGYFNSQCFAADSITISPAARFGKMSLIVNVRDTTAKGAVTGGIIITQGAKITGTLISVFRPKAKTKIPGPSIVAGLQSTVDGCIVSDGDVDISVAKLVGRIWCRSVVALKNNTTYTNFLFGTSFSPLQRSVAFPLCGDLPASIVFERFSK